MKVSDYIVNFLISNGVTHIFEVAGGAIAHLLDSLYDRKDISSVSMHHEMAAAIAAEGYSRVSGNIGVAMATSGPGATNLITGIGSTFFDSIPCIFITGQVNTYEFKFNKPVRQIGFQETDIVNIVKPIVKNAILIKDADDIRYYLERSISIAESNRPGPVLIDIPMNIQRADIDTRSLKSFNKSFIDGVVNKINNKFIKKVALMLKNSSRPVVLLGGGVGLSKTQDEVFNFINKTGIPVVTSLMGLDAFPHNSEYFVGMIGSYGNRYSNLTIANSDLVLALGTRLDTRQTGTRPETFARDAKIIHVDIDRRELNNKIKVNYSINCNLSVFMPLLNDTVINYNKEKIQNWRQQVKYYKDKYPSFKEPGRDAIEPNYFIYKLSQYMPEGAIVCVDIGQNQMWAAQSLEIKKSQRFITQGGMGSMGSALPLAIGASFAKPDKTIIVITGDGGFQLNIQELQTIYHHKLNIKIILINNHCYGMVKQFQEQYFNSRFQATVKGYSCPDFTDVVSAYKIKAKKIEKKVEINKSLDELFSNKKPMLLEVKICSYVKALPKLSVNKPLEDQEPLLPRDELESDMLIDTIS